MKALYIPLFTLLTGFALANECQNILKQELPLVEKISRISNIEEGFECLNNLYQPLNSASLEVKPLQFISVEERKDVEGRVMDLLKSLAEKQKYSLDFFSNLLSTLNIDVENKKYFSPDSNQFAFYTTFLNANTSPLYPHTLNPALNQNNKNQFPTFRNFTSVRKTHQIESTQQEENFYVQHLAVIYPLLFLCAIEDSEQIISLTGEYHRRKQLMLDFLNQNQKVSITLNILMNLTRSGYLTFSPPQFSFHKTLNFFENINLSDFISKIDSNLIIAEEEKELLFKLEELARPVIYFKTFLFNFMDCSPHSFQEALYISKVSKIPPKPQAVEEQQHQKKHDSLGPILYENFENPETYFNIRYEMVEYLIQPDFVNTLNQHSSRFFIHGADPKALIQNEMIQTYNKDWLSMLENINFIMEKE